MGTTSFNSTWISIKMMMRSVALVCLLVSVAAIPTPQVSEEKESSADIRKAVQDKAENPMAPFLEIMKEALNPNPDLKSFPDKDAKANPEAGLDQIMMKTAMALAATLSNPSAMPKNKDGTSPDPMAAVLMAIEKGLSGAAEGPNGDPILKLVQTGVKLLLSGETGESINPFQLLLEIIAPDGKPISDDPVMELMTNAVKAAANDKTGDPLNAMVTFVLEDPSTAQNPIVMMAKTMLTLFPQLTQGEEAEAKKL